MITANQTNIENILAQKDKPVLLDFYADWCGPCQRLLPIVEELSKDVGDDAIIAKINVDENRELASMFKVQSIPALFFIKDGKVMDRVNGLVPKSVLKEKIDKL